MDIRCRIAIWLSEWWPEALHLHDAEYVPVATVTVREGNIETLIHTRDTSLGGYWRCRRPKCPATRFVFW